MALFKSAGAGGQALAIRRHRSEAQPGPADRGLQPMAAAGGFLVVHNPTGPLFSQTPALSLS
jgi:hypothetical protein